MSTFASKFRSEADAIALLESEGFHLTASGEFWAKRGRVDPIAGGHMSTCLVTIERRRVNPIYNAPDYFELRFHH